MAGARGRSPVGVGGNALDTPLDTPVPVPLLEIQPSLGELHNHGPAGPSLGFYELLMVNESCEVRAGGAGIGI